MPLDNRQPGRRTGLSRGLFSQVTVTEKLIPMVITDVAESAAGRHRKLRNHIRQIHALGFEVTLTKTL